MQNENLQLVLSDDTILQISVIHSKDRAPISDTTSHVIHINQLLNQTVSGTQHLDLSGKISKLLKQLGITPNLKGYLYLRQAIEIGVRDASVFDGCIRILQSRITLRPPVYRGRSAMPSTLYGARETKNYSGA